MTRNSITGCRNSSTARKVFPQDASEAIQTVVCGSHKAAKIPATMKVAFRGSNGAVGRRDAMTHWIHWYPAKMFHRIPQQILSAVAEHEGMTILDPFCGSGTVLLEGGLKGHNTIGIDINPLASLIARVKTTPLSPRALTRSAKRIMDRAARDKSRPAADALFDYWFKPEVKRSLYRLRRSIETVRNHRYRDFFLVTLTSIVRACSLADPTIAPPVRLSERRLKVANDRYRRHFAKSQALNGKDALHHFSRAVENNIRRMSDLYHQERFRSAVVVEGTAQAASTHLPDASVDVILTSPPYCGAQKYVRSFRLEMTWLGISGARIAEVDKLTLGTERITMVDHIDELLTTDTNNNHLIQRIWKRDRTRAIMTSAYLKYLDLFAAECRRVLKPGGHAFVTFGTSHISGIEVDMSRYFRKAAERTGLRFVTTLVDVIPSRGMITERHKTAGRIDDERVVWLQG